MTIPLYYTLSTATHKEILSPSIMAIMIGMLMIFVLCQDQYWQKMYYLLISMLIVNSISSSESLLLSLSMGRQGSVIIVSNLTYYLLLSTSYSFFISLLFLSIYYYQFTIYFLNPYLVLFTLN